MAERPTPSTCTWTPFRRILFHMFVDTSPETHENVDAEPPPRLLYSVPEVAHALGGITTRHVGTLIRAGDLRSVKIGRRRLVPVEAIREYIAELENASAPNGAA